MDSAKSTGGEDANSGRGSNLAGSAYRGPPGFPSCDRYREFTRPNLLDFPSSNQALDLRGIQTEENFSLYHRDGGGHGAPASHCLLASVSRP
jgi:hypothetical protein